MNNNFDHSMIHLSLLVKKSYLSSMWIVCDGRMHDLGYLPLYQKSNKDSEKPPRQYPSTP